MRALPYATTHTIPRSNARTAPRYYRCRYSATTTCTSGGRTERSAALTDRKRRVSRYPSLEGTLDTIDVITPCTYERYLNTRHGSFQGFVHTATGKQLMQKGIVPGLKGFILSGQCIFQSGGLPPAAITGRFAAQRICKADGRPFMTKTRKENMLAERLRALSRKKATVSGG